MAGSPDGRTHSLADERVLWAVWHSRRKAEALRHHGMDYPYDRPPMPQFYLTVMIMAPPPAIPPAASLVEML